MVKSQAWESRLPRCKPCLFQLLSSWLWTKGWLSSTIKGRSNAYISGQYVFEVNEIAYVQCLAHSMHLISIIIFLEQIVFIIKTLAPSNFLPSCGLAILSHTSWSSPPFFFLLQQLWSAKRIKYLEAALWILLIKVILSFLPFLEAWSQLARLMWKKTCGVSELVHSSMPAKSPHPQVCSEGCGWTGDRRHSFSVLYVTSQANGQHEPLWFCNVSLLLSTLD